MGSIDLTPFGFTPTESLVYEALLRDGPGTGYAVARRAGLARANAYSALESLVTKGGARVEPGRPRQYRAEPPSGLVSRISNSHGLALERLGRELEAISTAESPTVVELQSGRSVLQVITHDTARATNSVALLLPPDAYPLLAPALRRPVSSRVSVSFWSTASVSLDFADVAVMRNEPEWPGMPIITVIDHRSAIIGSRTGDAVHGLWSTAPSFIAGARLAFERFTGTA
ncbi:MAG TPA: helix-turn-helix domain-containing protein [Gemmatimonadales bacterium]|nr:helix-turn-helix domain-containing protein [Gemmatimonadales bacterium]